MLPGASLLLASQAGKIEPAMSAQRTPAAGLPANPPAGVPPPAAPGRFATLKLLAGTAPGPQQLAAALMRGLITEAGAGGPSVVAAGIAEALVSTAAGLVVAIPAAIVAVPAMPARRCRCTSPVPCRRSTGSAWRRAQRRRPLLWCR